MRVVLLGGCLWLDVLCLVGGLVCAGLRLRCELLDFGV